MTVTGALELKFITLRKLKFFFWTGEGGGCGGFGMENFSFFPPSLAQKEANSTVFIHHLCVLARLCCGCQYFCEKKRKERKLRVPQVRATV